MALKYKLDQTGFDALSEAEKTFYTQNGDIYQLEVEGATDKGKLDEFRSNNVDLLKKLDQYKGVDMEEINELKSQKQKLLDAEFINKKDFEGLVDSRTKVLSSDYQAKIAALTSEIEESKINYTNLISKHEIEGAATMAFTKHKISPEATEAAMAQIKNKFTINNGAVVAMDGEVIEVGANGNLTVDEFVSTMPEIFKIQSSGGGGQGGGENAPQNHANSRSKITAGLSKMMNSG